MGIGNLNHRESVAADSGSLPLMGIGNSFQTTEPVHSRLRSHYPSWGLETSESGPLRNSETRLITPHGDWKRGQYHGTRHPQRHALITPHGDWKPGEQTWTARRYRPHYPSWGLETRAWPCLRGPSLHPHYPSWGLETPPLDPGVYRRGSGLITPHGDWKRPTARRPQGPANLSLPLITPHGDWKLDGVGGQGGNEVLITPHGDWKRLRRHHPVAVARLITPHGDWKRHR